MGHDAKFAEMIFCSFHDPDKEIPEEYLLKIKNYDDFKFD